MSDIIESTTRAPGAPVLRDVIDMGAIAVHRRWTSYNRDNWVLGPSALLYSDRALLAYCQYTPEFGGIVERFNDEVLVKVFTE